MGIARGAARVVAAGLVAGLVGLAPPAGAGSPTTITVTTTADVVDAGDGLTSLREAVIAASADPSVTDIVLAGDATYELTACGSGPAAGDLNLHHDGPLDLGGDEARIVQTCSDGLLTIESTVLDEEPLGPAVALDGLVLEGAGAAPGRIIDASGVLALRGVTITGTFSDGAVWSEGPLGVEASTFASLTGVETGARVIIAPRSSDIRTSTFSSITASSAIFGEAVSLADVDVVGNTFADVAFWLFEQAELNQVSIRGNTAFGLVGFAGDAGTGQQDPSFEMRDSVIAGNTLGRSGQGSHGSMAVTAVDPVITGTSIVGNTAIDGAPGIAMEDVDLVQIANSTIAGNTSLGASSPIHEWPAVVVDGGSLDLRYTTITGNTVPAGQAAVEAESMSAVGSVVEGPGDDCAIAGSTGSGGGNVAGDATCGFDHATDQESVADLGLEPLDLDAAVPVLVPEPSSPLVDAITAPGCGSLLPFDQRGLPRPSPQPTGDCDAGAVELQQPFSDVPLTHTFFSDIGWAAEEGIAGGFPDGTYRPGAAVARQAMAAFLYRLAGEPAFDPPAEAKFSDVPVTSTFFAEIEWLVAEDIAGGFADGTFRPGQAVSRQAMAAFLYRFAGSPAFDPPSEATFSDVAAGSTFFHEVEWLTGVGVAGGFADGTFRPGVAVTRQAMAAFLHRLAEI
jgi:hypothetical protein